MNQPISLLETARWFVERKMKVFPVHTPTPRGCSCGSGRCQAIGKHPRTVHGFKDGSLDLAIVQFWWKKWPNANIGVQTGIDSGIVVLDVDPRHGGDDSLIELEKRIGQLPPTWTMLTGGGGLHYYFKHPGGQVGNRTKMMDGLDLRGDGGYVVGTTSLHASGRRYVWDVSSPPDEVNLAPLPPDLIRLKSTQDLQFQSKTKDWIVHVTEGAPEGTRNQTITSLSGHLMNRKVESKIILTLIRSYNMSHCHPPLDDEEVKKIVESIAYREGKKRGLWQ